MSASRLKFSKILQENFLIIFTGAISCLALAMMSYTWIAIKELRIAALQVREIIQFEQRLTRNFNVFKIDANTLSEETNERCLLYTSDAADE